MKVFILIVLLGCVGTCLGWSATGHQLTAFLAQSLLSPTANAYAVKVLPSSKNGSLAIASTWADEIKSDHTWDWSQPLHYIDTPDNLCNYNYNRDCKNVATGEADVCVSGAITNYTYLLLNNDPDNYSDLQSESIMFLTHFVGDIHQPLHVGFTSDLGGNKITVEFFNVSTNLHSVWDYYIINRRITLDFNGNSTLYGLYLLDKIKNGFDGYVSQWSKCNSIVCPDTWAEESVTFACNSSYANISSGVISEEYYQRAIVVVDARLAAGGVRLAAAIEYIANNVDDASHVNVVVGAVLGSVLGAALIVLIVASVIGAIRKKRSRVAYSPI